MKEDEYEGSKVQIKILLGQLVASTKWLSFSYARKSFVIWKKSTLSCTKETIFFSLKYYFTAQLRYRRKLQVGNR